MNKSCGGCKHWNKWKKSNYRLSSDGLCNKHDWRCASDYVCDGWKGKKYDRSKSDLEKALISDSKSTFT